MRFAGGGFEHLPGPRRLWRAIFQLPETTGFGQLRPQNKADRFTICKIFIERVFRAMICEPAVWRQVTVSSVSGSQIK
ncbi:MAG TPA: hypothetical protein VLD18_13830, partial [Verrucomicrobiae bacterium]|nr:hypothetical protein [Verrucomicrobiae bacterium]